MTNTNDADLLDEIEAAIWGAYEAAPNGEGVAGALYFASIAAFNVAKGGMKAPEAVAKAIGNGGTYGVPRRYALVPREASEAMLAAVDGDDAVLASRWRDMVKAAEA